MCGTSVVVLWVKTTTYNISIPFQSAGLSLAKAQLPANASGNVTKDFSRAWIPVTHVGGQDGFSRSWLWPGPFLTLQIFVKSTPRADFFILSHIFINIWGTDIQFWPRLSKFYIVDNLCIRYGVFRRQIQRNIGVVKQEAQGLLKFHMDSVQCIF